MEEEYSKNNLMVLGNNQDGCLLTGDKIDVRDFLSIHNEELKCLADINRGSFRIKTGMNMCAAYLKERSSYVLLWGRNVDNINKFMKIEFPENIKKCVIGDSHILFLLNTGEAYSAGEGHNRQLGYDDQINVSFNNPYKLNFKTKITNIYTGIRTSFFIDGI